MDEGKIIKIVLYSWDCERLLKPDEETRNVDGLE